MARADLGVPLTSSHGLIRDGDRILLIQRKRPPLQGYWGLPGGGVELGETVAGALHREIREETGLTLASTRFLGYFDGILREDGRVRYHYVMMIFEGTPAGGQLTPSDDAAAARWVTLAEARTLQLTDTVIRALALAGLEPAEGRKGDAS